MKRCNGDIDCDEEQTGDEVCGDTSVTCSAPIWVDAVNYSFTKCLRRYRTKESRERNILRCKEEIYDKQTIIRAVGKVCDVVHKEY